MVLSSVETRIFQMHSENKNSENENCNFRGQLLEALAVIETSDLITQEVSLSQRVWA